MEKLQDKYIRFDWAIKCLLRQKANYGILEGFLTIFLGERVIISKILDCNDSPNTLDSSTPIYIEAIKGRADKVLIEIQNLRELHYFERNTIPTSSFVTEHISLGEKYYKVKKVYSISVLYFDIGKGADFLYHGQNQFIGVHTGDQLQVNVKEQGAIRTRMPSDIFPEYILIRVNEFNKVAVNPIEEWMEYLKNGVISPDTKAPGLSEAREKLKYYSMTPQEQHAYDEHLSAVMIQNDVLDTAKLEGREEGRAKGRAEGLAEGRAEGLAEGRAEGRAEGLAEGEIKAKFETARNMKSMGLSPEIIQKAIGMSIEEIEKL